MSTVIATIRGGERLPIAADPRDAEGSPQRRLRSNRVSLILVAAVVLVALGAGIAPALLGQPNVERDFGWIAAAAIFASSYVTLAIGRIPGLALDRAGIALVGAALMVACGALPLDEAYRAVDLDTLTLLLGMMIVVAHLRLSGFLSSASGWVMRRSHRPLMRLAAITAIAGVLSAFLVNDAICLVLAPLVIELARSSRRNPVPYLLAVVMASNVGSTATITGNPQNMIVGSLSHIGYGDFTAVLGPVALIGIVLTAVLIALLHRHGLASSERLEPDPPRPGIDRVMVIRALAARDDDEQAGEHQQQRPVDLGVDALTPDPSRKQQGRADDNRRLGRRLAGKEQHQQTHRPGELCRPVSSPPRSSCCRSRSWSATRPTLGGASQSC